MELTAAVSSRIIISLLLLPLLALFPCRISSIPACRGDVTEYLGFVQQL